MKETIETEVRNAEHAVDLQKLKADVEGIEAQIRKEADLGSEGTTGPAAAGRQETTQEGRAEQEQDEVKEKEKEKEKGPDAYGNS
jgi:hypothetical protein